MQVLGIDVGGTKVEIASVVDGRALEPLQIPTPLESSDALIDGLEELARQVIERDGTPEAIGVGVPSRIDVASGSGIASVNIPLEGVQLRDERQNRYGGTDCADSGRIGARRADGGWDRGWRWAD